MYVCMYVCMYVGGWGGSPTVKSDSFRSCVRACVRAAAAAACERAKLCARERERSPSGMSSGLVVRVAMARATPGALWMDLTCPSQGRPCQSPFQTSFFSYFGSNLQVLRAIGRPSI